MFCLYEVWLDLELRNEMDVDLSAISFLLEIKR